MSPAYTCLSYMCFKRECCWDVAGMLKVEGLLQSGCRMWDTPGVPHRFQLSSKLTADEVCLCTLSTVA